MIKFKQHNRFSLLWLAWLCFCCFACSDDRNSVDDELSSYPISFALSPASPVAAEAGSRAVMSDDGYFLAADSVGIFAYSYIASSVWTLTPDIFNNAKGTVGALPSVGEAQKVTIAEAGYYVSSRNHAFYSYYPYRSTLSATNPVHKSDLFSELEPDKTQSDWLWAKVIDVMPSTSPVGFTYSHMMSLIRVAVAKSTDVTAALKMESITVGTSTSQKFEFDVSTGVITKVLNGTTAYTTPLLSSFGSDVPALVGLQATELAAQILLLPMSRVTSLSFRINGEDFTTPDTWAGFDTSVAGKYKMVSVVISASEITIQLGGLPWNGGDDIDVSQTGVTISLGANPWGYDHATDIDVTQSTITISLGAKGWVDYDTRIEAKKN